MNNIHEIYTCSNTAQEELKNRWNNSGLRAEVESFLKNDVPDFLRDAPKAYLARCIATPNFELLKFLEIAELMQLKPVCPEFRNDKFIAKNPDKYYYAKMVFYSGKGRNGGEKLSATKVVDFQSSEGMPLHAMKTVWGETFVDFHHRLLHPFVEKFNIIIPDISLWLSQQGRSPQQFYQSFIALFICHAVLCDNFLVHGHEGKFTTDILLPSIEKVSRLFGVKPLIVPITTFADENDLHRHYYPYFLKNLIL
jgi:hypothetical protein